MLPALFLLDGTSSKSESQGLGLGCASSLQTRNPRAGEREISRKQDLLSSASEGRCKTFLPDYRKDQHAWSRHQ